MTARDRKHTTFGRRCDLIEKPRQCVLLSRWWAFVELFLIRVKQFQVAVRRTSVGHERRAVVVADCIVGATTTAGASGRFLWARIVTLCSTGGCAFKTGRRCGGMFGRISALTGGGETNIAIRRRDGNGEDARAASLSDVRTSAGNSRLLCGHVLGHSPLLSYAQ